eukprot:TRINITY_DN948_c0_g1_i3.p1 TRINITY_DN948_c0_g1~~TRINITY_DN948_c0_g1_i3.p1  ORF type:complete len:521 (-),score=47.47 TRINITY_DN948_c0_g1_i3:1026-2588(-)
MLRLCITILILLIFFQEVHVKPIASFVDGVLPEDKLITVDSSTGQFLRGGFPYKFAGLNFWSAPFLDSDRLTKELDLLKQYNITNFRVMALSEGGTIDEDIEKVYGPRRLDPAVSDDPCAFESLGEDIGLIQHAENLRRMLIEFGKRDMSAVLVLNNEYYWSGGMPQYMKWAYDAKWGTNETNVTEDGDCYDQFDQPDLIYFLFNPSLYTLEDFMSYDDYAETLFEFEMEYDDEDGCYMEPLSGSFQIPLPNIYDPEEEVWGQSWNDMMRMSQLFMCNRRAQYYFLRRVYKLIQLVTETGSLEEKAHVRNAIMSWQLSNEPRCFNGWDYLCTDWIRKTVRLIKLADSAHLVSLGSEGLLPFAWGDYANIGYAGYHVGTGLDYLTVHAWPENWGWYSKEDRNLVFVKSSIIQYVYRHIAIASSLKMPIVLEESGLARDGYYDINSSVSDRDDYIDFLITFRDATPYLEGLNFWAWGGYGVPSEFHWHKGDDYIGDPPHEHQGWYSIFEYDDSTLQLIGKAN